MENSGIHLLSAVERFWINFGGCREHNWSFPQTDKGLAYEKPYNSHQQCPVCGATRLFNSNDWESGPLFKREVKQHG